MLRDEVEFDYRFEGGSAIARFAVRPRQVDLTVGLGDALGDLLRAVLLLVEGDGEARASRAELPGEYRWILRRRGDRMRVRVLEFPGLWSNAPDREGATIFDASCDLSRFVAAVAVGARRAVEELAKASYRKQRMAPALPIEHLNLLEEAVADMFRVVELPRTCRHGHRAVKHPDGWWDAACQGYLCGGPCANGHYWILAIDEHGNDVPPGDDYLCPECRELEERSVLTRGD